MTYLNYHEDPQTLHISLLISVLPLPSKQKNDKTEFKKSGDQTNNDK